MNIPQKQNASSGIMQIAIGLFFVSPLVTNPGLLKNNILAYVTIGMGFLLLNVGTTRFSNKLAQRRSAIGKAVSTRYFESPNNFLRPETLDNSTKDKQPCSTNLNVLGMLPVSLSYIIAVLSLLGAIYLIVLAPIGSASGVPIAVGLLVAGAVYAIGKSCQG